MEVTKIKSKNNFSVIEIKTIHNKTYENYKDNYNFFYNINSFPIDLEELRLKNLRKYFESRVSESKAAEKSIIHKLDFNDENNFFFSKNSDFVMESKIDSSSVLNYSNFISENIIYGIDKIKKNISLVKTESDLDSEAVIYDYFDFIITQNLVSTTEISQNTTDSQPNIIKNMIIEGN